MKEYCPPHTGKSAIYYENPGTHFRLHNNTAPRRAPEILDHEIMEYVGRL